MTSSSQSLPSASAAFYRRTMQVLDEADVPYLVAGARAFARYTGIDRHTKDFDLFVAEDDMEATLEALSKAGYPTERDFAHWLGKAYHEDDTIDLIYRTANGVAVVDASWFEVAPEDEVLGIEARLCPPEELLWTKAFIMERERCDAADVAHLLHACGHELDWPRLLRRFGEHWRLLLSHLVLFQFIYPGDHDCVPDDVMDDLLGRLERGENPEQGSRLCRGTLLSRTQYVVDVEEWGYDDARLSPYGSMSTDEVETWKDAADGRPPTSE